MKKIVLLLLPLLAFVGCRPAIKMVYGIHQPRVENQKSINKFIEKKELADDNNYSLPFDEYVSRLQRMKKLPSIYIFDKQRNNLPFISKKDSTTCNASSYDFVSMLDPKYEYEIDSAIHYTDHAKYLVDLTGKASEITPPEDADYVVFVYWATFMGKVNKQQTKRWEEAVKGNSNAKIAVYKVNMDFQEHWGEENLKSLKSGMHKKGDSKLTTSK